MAARAVGRTQAWARRWLPSLVPGALMLTLGSWGVGRASMFGSEADTYWAAHLPVPRLLHLLEHVDAVHGTYYLLMHAWFRLGSGVVWLRLPSVLGMALAAVLTSVLGIRLTGSRRVGLLAGVLFALNPSISDWGQNGRSYALVCAAVALMTWALLRAVDGDGGVSARRWSLFGAALTVCGYLHEMTLLLAPAYGISLVAARVPRAVLRRWSITTAVSGCCVAPVVLASIRERGAVAWLRRPGSAAVQTLLRQLFGTSWPVVGIICGLVVLAAVPLLSRHAPTGRLTLPLLAVPMLVVPAGLLLLESELGHPLFDPRYVLYSTIAAGLLAASGAERVAGALSRLARRLGWRRSAILAALPAGALCVTIALQQWPEQQYLRTTASRREDYLAASQFLEAHAVSGDAVLFMNPSARSADLAYPEDFRALRDIAELRSPERSGTFRGVDRPDAAVLAAIRASDRVWVLGPYPLRRNPRGLAGAAALLSRDFRAAVIARFAGVTDVRYDRAAAPATL